MAVINSKRQNAVMKTHKAREGRKTKGGREADTDTTNTKTVSHTQRDTDTDTHTRQNGLTHLIP